MLRTIGLFALVAWLAPVPAHAARFTNQFIEFELPPQWQCNLEGTEWVCQSTVDTKKKDAIIVLAAKLKGDQDSLDQYLTYLKSPKSYTSVSGKNFKSEVRYAKTMKIQDAAWVDALHSESEIPGFLTRYLATVKLDIGVLVTYSVNKDKWKEYVSAFEAMVNTIKVFRTAGAPIIAKQTGENLFTLPTTVEEGAVFSPPPTGSPEPGQQKKPAGNFTGIILGAAAVVLFLLWRRRRGGD